jgi:hypothetical protein
MLRRILKNEINIQQLSAKPVKVVNYKLGVLIKKPTLRGGSLILKKIIAMSM